VQAGLVALCLFGIACGGPSEPSGGDPAPTSSYEGTWRLTDVSGPDGDVPIVKGYRITLDINGGSVVGKSACNTYGGRIDTTGDNLRLDGLGGTEMGCARSVMRSETAYLNALAVADTIEREGNTLVLTGPDSQLLFELETPPPVAELTDTTWQLESLLEGSGNEASGSSAAASAELVLRSDGTLSGTTGCQDLEGEWVQRADEIVFSVLSSKGRCGADASPELKQQDIHVAGVLGDGFTYDLEGQTLTVFGMGGLGLQYTGKPGG
jgi:heat shock protein HslJ